MRPPCTVSFEKSASSALRSAAVRKAEVQNLALSDQLFDRAGDVLDRDVRIDAMLIEKIDAVGAEALERGIDDRLDVFR
jgi:hypothetical protein